MNSVCPHGLDDSSAVGELVDNFEVVLQVQQRGESGANQVLVISKQQADGHRVTSSRVPGSRRMISRLPPAVSTRRYITARPLCFLGSVSELPVPLSSTRSLICSPFARMLIVQVVALGCRITLVTASRIT